MSKVTANVGVPAYQPDQEKHRRNVAQWAQWVNQGHLSNIGSVTLTASAATTTVTDDRVGATTVPILQPSTAKGLSAQPTVYVSSVTNGSFIITHSSSVATTKTFRYALLG